MPPVSSARGQRAGILCSRVLRSEKPSAGSARPLKPREQAARAEQARVAAEQRKRDAFMATPIGAATLAKETGQAFFEVQLEVGGHSGSAGFGSTHGSRLHERRGDRCQRRHDRSLPIPQQRSLNPPPELLPICRLTSADYPGWVRAADDAGRGDLYDPNTFVLSRSLSPQHQHRCCSGHKEPHSDEE